MSPLADLPPVLEVAKNKNRKKYDFFVSFSDKDKEWVYYSFLKKIETMYKFKGCIADRDFTLGESIFENIQSAIQESVCTIVILTPDFNLSKWCKTELAKAFHRCHRDDYSIIPVKLKECDIPDCLIDITWLDAVQYFQWERLENALNKYCNVE